MGVTGAARSPRAHAYGQAPNSRRSDSASHEASTSVVSSVAKSRWSVSSRSRMVARTRERNVASS